MKKPKQHEWDDSLDFIVGTGSITLFTATPKDEKPAKRKPIGFIKDVQQDSHKDPVKRKRKTKSGSSTKGKTDK